MNLYADVDMFKRTFTNDSDLDEADLVEIENRLESCSRRVDEHTRRKFFAETDTKYFAGDGRSFVRIPDLLSATSVKLDEDGDRIYELTLQAATDYFLEREFHDDVDSSPKTVLRLDETNGQRSMFLCRKRLVEIVGVWGFTQATEQVAGTATLADGTTETMTTSNAGVLCTGQTLKIESEQVYVRGGDAKTWTVTRGVNGTTAVAHAAQAMQRYVYVPEVRDATLILAGRLWKRRDASYANVIANEVVGTMSVFRALDPDVEQLLAPLRRMEA